MKYSDKAPILVIIGLSLGTFIRVVHGVRIPFLDIFRHRTISDDIHPTATSDLLSWSASPSHYQEIFLKQMYTTPGPALASSSSENRSQKKRKTLPLFKRYTFNSSTSPSNNAICDGCTPLSIKLALAPTTTNIMISPITTCLAPLIIEQIGIVCNDTIALGPSLILPCELTAPVNPEIDVTITQYITQCCNGKCAVQTTFVVPTCPTITITTCGELCEPVVTKCPYCTISTTAVTKELTTAGSTVTVYSPCANIVEPATIPALVKSSMNVTVTKGLVAHTKAVGVIVCATDYPEPTRISIGTGITTTYTTLVCTTCNAAKIPLPACTEADCNLVEVTKTIPCQECENGAKTTTVNFPETAVPTAVRVYTTTVKNCTESCAEGVSLTTVVEECSECETSTAVIAKHSAGHSSSAAISVCSGIGCKTTELLSATTAKATAVAFIKSSGIASAKASAKPTGTASAVISAVAICSGIECETDSPNIIEGAASTIYIKLPIILAVVFIASF